MPWLNGTTRLRNGTALQVRGASDAANRQWHAGQNSDGSFTLTNIAGGRVLDQPGAKTTNGTRMQVRDANGGANQHRNLG
ncbi:RICIN domain-containing protein [Kitasatospora sp. NPDC093679]|uniref:RICIN domain-containing protein n=1 Tax=Kitasatospora sp. NPDC093679 TaxID=3154983 RepID=UPI0034345ACD